ASPRAPSSRSFRECPTGPSAASSACPSRGSPSAPPGTSSRGRHRPSPASSTRTPVSSNSAICLGEVCLWSTLLSLSCGRVFPAQECSHPWKKGIPMTYLGFEFAVPSRFVVFATPYNADRLPGQMAIYSSETGQWSYVQSKWSSATHVDCSRRTHVFLNGTMHLATLCNSIIPTVDVEGKVWKEIQMPVDWASSNIVLTGQSQGRLYAWQLDYCDDSELDIWVLEDYGTGKWTLKHTVNVSELFGRHCRKDGDFYQMFAIHPDCNVIFLTNQKKMTVSYDMDNQKVHVICNEFMIGLPYIPCFAELPSAGH
uniref:F-box protein At3g26010-like beta-propeller domain-containing protein n=1 Tax=Aegilops tauschii subsp. strangulata TaxID=200361 RepID=A0A452ZYG2_AEGTS